MLARRGSLAVHIDGPGPEAPPDSRAQRVVLVHGFTQSAASWHQSADLLAGGFEVVRMDLPGHGASDRVRLDFDQTAAAVGDAGGAGIYVGYSMGGRLALRLAIDRPALVKALVLVGASPGLADQRDRAARRHSDEQLAAEIEQIGTRAFLARWLTQPIFAGLQPTAIDLAARQANSASGLAAALRLLGTGQQEPLWDRLGELAMPVLAVAGGLDSKSILVAGRMAGSIGENARVAVLPGASHAPQLQQPKPFCQMVWRFLHPRPLRTRSTSANSTSSAGSGAGLRNFRHPSSAKSGSATTSPARRLALPRPQA